LKNVDQWRPTKFVRTRRGLRASRDPACVAVSSRFIGDITAQRYEQILLAHAAGALLDVGCGHVPLYQVYRDLVTDIVCVDWSNTLHGNSLLDHVVDLNKKLPLASSTFDTVLLTDVLEHLADPLFTMRDLARVLRPGGKLLLGVPFFYWIHEEPHDYYRYTEFALARFCELSELKIICLEAYGGLPEVLLDLSSKAIGTLPNPLPTILRPLHAAATHLNSFSPVRKLSEWTRSQFQLGYVLVAQKL